MQNRRRPRALTLTLPDAKQPCLMLAGQKYTLRNFSEDGMGLWVPTPAPFGLAAGSQISGDVVIGNNIYPVKLEIRHHSKGLVGLRMVHKSKDLTVIFRQLLEPAFHAAELSPQPLSGKEDPTNGFSRLWYTSPSGNELIVWYEESQKVIHALQLCWLGKWVYRAQLRPPQTGFLRDESRVTPGTLVTPEELLLRHTESDEEMLNQAAQFLGSAPPPLPGYRLWQFLEMGEQVSLPLDFFQALKVA